MSTSLYISVDSKDTLIETSACEVNPAKDIVLVAPTFERSPLLLIWQYPSASMHLQMAGVIIGEENCPLSPCTMLCIWSILTMGKAQVSGATFELILNPPFPTSNYHAWSISTRGKTQMSGAIFGALHQVCMEE